MFSSLLEGYPVSQLLCSHSELWFVHPVRTTLAWRNVVACEILASIMVLFSCLPLTALLFRIYDFCTLLSSPQAIGSISLGNNVVSMTISVSQSLTRQRSPCTYRKSLQCTTSCHWFLKLKSPSFPQSFLSKTKDASIRRASTVTLCIGVRC